MNDFLVTCTTPKVTAAYSASGNPGNRKKRQADSSDVVTVGFIMADVTSLLIWSDGQPEFKFFVVNDPKFNQFANDMIYELDGSKLQITVGEFCIYLFCILYFF